MLGGSSSINGLLYIRGQAEDFDHWRQLGNAGWSFHDVLPYFRRAYRLDPTAARVEIDLDLFQFRTSPRQGN